MTQFRRTAPGDQLGARARFRLTFGTSDFAKLLSAAGDVFGPAMQRTYDRISATGLVFPISTLALAPGDLAAVVDVRVKTGADAATVAALVSRLDALENVTTVETIERLGDAPEYPAEEARVLDRAQRQATAEQASRGPLAAVGSTLDLVKWLAIAAAVAIVAYILWQLLREGRQAITAAS